MRHYPHYWRREIFAKPISCRSSVPEVESPTQSMAKEKSARPMLETLPNSSASGRIYSFSSLLKIDRATSTSKAQHPERRPTVAPAVYEVSPIRRDGRLLEK